MTWPSPVIVSIASEAAAIVIFALPVGFGIAAIGRRFEGASQMSGRLMAVASGVVTLGVFASWASAGASPPALWIDLGLDWSLLGLAAIDILALRLPDAVTIPLALAGLWLAGPLAAPLSDRFAGLAVGVAAIAGLDVVYVRLRRRSGIGLGDAKLFGAAGAWLGWRALPSVLLVACAMGLVWFAARLLTRAGATGREPMPFGAPLCAALLLLWLLRG